MKGSGLPKRRCEYLIDVLVESGLLTPQLQAKGATKPFNIYLFKGDNEEYAREALRLHNDELGGQLALEDAARLNWVTDFVADLKAHHWGEVDRPKIVRRCIEENGDTLDRKLAAKAVKLVEESGITVNP